MPIDARRLWHVIPRMLAPQLNNSGLRKKLFLLKGNAVDFRFMQWKPTRIGSKACPLGNVLGPSEKKGPWLATTGIETPVS
jgi:hypothetical protein